jgi:hypothetical protein
LVNGGRILQQFGLSGTYYASFGLMRQHTPTGEIFGPDDLPELWKGRHELGCHTFDHCPAWDTPPEVFAASVESNARAFAALAPGSRFETLSYPITWPRPRTKKLIQSRFLACRGGGQRHNLARVDLNYLSAFFIEQSDADGIKRILRQTVQENGWLILATHDVCENPTRFGCTMELFSRVVKEAVAFGADVLPVSKALACQIGAVNHTGGRDRAPNVMNRNA